MKRPIALICFFLGLGLLALRAEAGASRVSFCDSSRNREISAAIYEPLSVEQPARFAIVSAGYGVPDTSYSFLADALCRSGVLVVCIQHHLPSDPPLAQSGNLRTLRMPAWQNGVRNLEFVIAELKRTRPALATMRPILIGHSNGGDISCLFAALHPAEIACLITLDHRRMPLPRLPSLRCLSIRAAEFDADHDVLPTPERTNAAGISIVRLSGTKHMDLTDQGPESTKEAVVELVTAFVVRPMP